MNVANIRASNFAVRCFFINFAPVMNVTSWISRHLKLSGGASRSSSAGVVIAVTGVALALMIMEFSLCIVLGFKQRIRDKISGFESEITIEPRYLDSSGATAETIALTEEIHDAIRQSAPQARVSLAVRQPVMLKTENDFCAIILTAHDDSHDSGFERSLITGGRWPDYSQDSCANHIVISESTAKRLQIETGQRIDATFFVDGNIKSRRYTVAGIYRSDIEDYDATIAFGDIKSLRKVAGMDSLSGSGIDISGLPIDSVPDISQRLYDILLQKYYDGRSEYIYPVDTVLHKGSMYFNWLSLLDTNVVVIFVLMMCVAGFTLVSSLFLIVLERVSTIGILRSMGASKKLIRNIFRRMAMRMALWGMLAGNLAGLGLMYLQQQYGFIHLDPQMYYLNEVPVEFSFTGLLLINIGVAVSAWAVLTLPAIAAARIDPAQSARYE